MALHTFNPGDGINAQKLNENFVEIQGQVNDNETDINTIESTALKKDGSNLTQTIIDEFQQETPIVLSGSGNIYLSDNRVHFLTLTANNTNRVVLPTPADDNYSHTVVLIVQGSNYSLNVPHGCAGSLYNDTSVNPYNAYSVMYVWNKINKLWYYSLTQ